MINIYGSTSKFVKFLNFSGLFSANSSFAAAPSWRPHTKTCCRYSRGCESLKSSSLSTKQGWRFGKTRSYPLLPVLSNRTSRERLNIALIIEVYMLLPVLYNTSRYTRNHFVSSIIVVVVFRSETVWTMMNGCYQDTCTEKMQRSSGEKGRLL